MTRIPPQTEMHSASPIQSEVCRPRSLPNLTTAMQLQPMASTVGRRQSLASASTHSAESERSKVVSSARSSLEDAIRPMTSMSRLIRPHSWTPTSSTAPSQPSPGRPLAQYPTTGPVLIDWRRRESAHSSRSRSQSDASTYSSRSRPETQYRSRLETIPGSRTNSPGRPLNGPFPLDTSGKGRRLGSGSLQVVDPQDTSSDDNEQVSQRPQVQRFFTALTAPEPSPPLVKVEDESHIHPLFRTASPVPPPNRTAGTVVTASSHGGQYMTPKTLNSATRRSRATNTLYDSSRARSHSRLGTRARQQLLPIPHTVVRARSLETMDSWQTRLEEGDNPLTIQQLSQAARPKQQLQPINDENTPPTETSPGFAKTIQVKPPQKRRSDNNIIRASSTRTTPRGTPRRALSETSGNVRSTSVSPRRSARKSRDATRSSISLRQRRNEAVPEIQIYVDLADR